MRDAGNTMEIGETFYFQVAQTLGTINVCGTSKSDLASAEYGASIMKLDVNYEYGTHLSYTIELYQKGMKQDIKLNDCIFSFLVKCTWHSYRTSPDCIDLILQVKMNDEISDIEVCSRNFPESLSKNGNIILDIIYSMILISEIKSIEKFEEIWSCFYLYPTVSSYTLGDAITQITKFQETVKGIVEKYPFAKPFFEKLLKNKIEATKNALSEIDFLKQKSAFT